jgi:hypothetical protein
MACVGTARSPDISLTNAALHLTRHVTVAIVGITTTTVIKVREVRVTVGKVKVTVVTVKVARTVVTVGTV